MTDTSRPRRQFLIATGSTALAAGVTSLGANAQTPAVVDPKDPQAVALGYVPDAKKVDAKKWPKYAAGQLCSNCNLYQGKPTDKLGGCPIFAGKQVAGPGWCNAWLKKP